MRRRYGKIIRAGAGQSQVRAGNAESMRYHEYTLLWPGADGGVPPITLHESTPSTLGWGSSNPPRLPFWVVHLPPEAC